MRFGILFVLLVVIYLAFNLFVKKAKEEQIAQIDKEIAGTKRIGEGLALMLSHRAEWPNILSSQRRDLQFIRSVIPEAPFNEKVFLERLISVFHTAGVFSEGLSIRPVRPAPSQTSFYDFFTKDIVGLAGCVDAFHTSFVYLKGSDTVAGEQLKRSEALMLKPGYTEEDLELALWYSFRFNQMMSVGVPEGIKLLPGLEMHRFDTTIRGTYDQIKYFIWLIQHMRPHTIIVNWHLSPGKGTGESRPYSASLSLMTFADTNMGPTYERDPDDPLRDSLYAALPDIPNVTPLLKVLGFV
jgi:hypothetical protein